MQDARDDEPRWRLRLVGTPSLRQGDKQTLLGRKSAGLLAYLALHGATPRARLAYLLWSNLETPKARTNLRALLFELSRFGGLLKAGDPLELSPDVRPELTRPDGDLLEGLDYDDLPEFSEWLDQQRRVLTERRADALAADIHDLERKGAFADALPLAKRLVNLEPLSEAHHRRVMRLLYLSGDRAAALDAYHGFQSVLKRDLGVEPLLETVALAREIDRGTVTPAARPKRRELPLSIAKPPVLAGRERAWARMEEAWARGQVIFVAGAAGVGKTRLVLDFAASKGNFLLFQGRPGDRTVPHASSARFIRQMVNRSAHLTLEPWVRRELSRILPELAESELLPLRTPEEVGRMLRAVVALGHLCLPWLSTYFTDDLHLLDSASFEAGFYLSSRMLTGVGGERLGIAVTVRLDEMDPHDMGRLYSQVEAGLAVLIELEPLDVCGVKEMLGGVDVPGVEVLTEPLYKLTGGNPLFIVETLKSLVESGELDKSKLGAVFPEKVGMVLEGRFRRLSKGALRLLQLWAVAQGDFSVALASQVLELTGIEVAEKLAELEAAQMVRGPDFSHDLMYEAVRRATPTALTTFFHGACAQFLQAHGGESARVAYHFWEAGEVQRALPHYLSAVEVALVQGAFAQARVWLHLIMVHAPQGSALHDEAKAWLGRVQIPT